MPRPAGQAHPNIFRGFLFYMKAYFTVLISKWNNFKLLMLSTLLVIINHRAISEERNQEASVVTRSPFLG